MNNKESALLVLERALNMANKAGAFNLNDATTVQNALNIIALAIKSQGQTENEVEQESK